MKGFLFTGRVAVLLNLLFVICLVLRALPEQLPEWMSSFLLIGGWLLSVPVNCIWLLWFMLLGRKNRQAGAIPRLFLWGIPAFLIFQLLYFFF
jgi:hypothetical protein